MRPAAWPRSTTCATKHWWPSTRIAWWPGSLHQLGDDPYAELTLLVEDAYQGQHLGRQMLAELFSAASTLGFRRLWAEVLPDNIRVLRLLETAGFAILVDPYFGLTRVLVYL
jgi:RimJ/RimL family protein N-acetyltransferase